MNIKITLVGEGKFIPAYQSDYAAGMDLQASISKPLVLKPMQRMVIPTGIAIALPKGLEAQVRPRSGLAAKHGITVLNSPGTIDADYRGEIGVILINLGNQDFEIKPGERIAQLVVATYEHVVWRQVKSLNETKRGAGGFGSTNK